MRILDVDMDYFLSNVASNISQDSESRLEESSYYRPWEKEKIEMFLENNLGLSKKSKARGRIVKHHNEALYYWRELVEDNQLQTPFEVIHVDAHADLGLGYSSWQFILNKLLRIDVDKRAYIEKYSEWFDEFKQPGIGDYLLYCLAFRWIKSLTYIYHPTEDGNDYIYYIFKDAKEPEFWESTGVIQLAPQKRLLMSIDEEPEVQFIRQCDIAEIEYDGKFDFIIFCQSPNYTPKSLDFAMEVIKQYIELE